MRLSPRGVTVQTAIRLLIFNNSRTHNPMTIRYWTILFKIVVSFLFLFTGNFQHFHMKVYMCILRVSC
jgi:hypothetical protein